MRQDNKMLSRVQPKPAWISPKTALKSLKSQLAIYP